MSRGVPIAIKGPSHGGLGGATIKKSIEALTLDDMGELMNMCETAYTGIPSRINGNMAVSMPTLAQYVQAMLGQLYMYRIISEQDLRDIAGRATAWHSQWARASFVIGLEAGLGNIEDSDVQPYLSACNRPYAQSLLGLISLLLNRGKVDPGYAEQVGGWLSSLLGAASVQLANLGQASHETIKVQYEGMPSPVAAFLREIHVSAVKGEPEPANAVLPTTCTAGIFCCRTESAEVAESTTWCMSCAV